MRSARILLLSGLALMGARIGAGETWQSVANGISYLRLQHYHNEDRSAAWVSVVRIDPKRLAIRIIDLKRYLNTTRDQPAYTLSELVEDMRPLVAINGGFNQSTSFPLATGLLISEGTRLSPVNVTTDYQDGVVCVSATGAPRLSPIARFQTGACREGLQAGPLFISGGAVFRNLSRVEWRTRIRRSVVATSAASEVILAVSTESSLSAVAAFFSAELRNAGVQVDQAMNLGGAQASGLYVAAAGGQFEGARNSVLSSVLVGVPRTPARSARPARKR